MRQGNTDKLRHFCVRCGRTFPHAYTSFCPCGGMVDIEYDLERARLRDADNIFERYFDFLPICDRSHLLPAPLTPTPTRHAAVLGAQLGLERLYLKDETVLPTRSTKDRMAIVVHSFFREIGIRQFSASSTGNSSTALAHYTAFAPACRLFLFVAEEFLHRLQVRQTEQVVVYCLRGATFVEACDEARAYAERTGLVSERGYFNPARREGLKTSFFEAAEAIPAAIDWYVQAVSSAMGVYGVYKGAREWSRMGLIPRPPRLLCVQQESCCPMVKAFRDQSPVIRPQDVVHTPSGIASSILRGNPTRSYPYTFGIVRDSGGLMSSVTESQIREARDMVRELEDVDCCFTASAAVAGLIQAVERGRIDRSATVLVNLTGADRQPGDQQNNVCYLVRSGSGWQPQAGNDSAMVQLWEEPL